MKTLTLKNRVALPPRAMLKAVHLPAAAQALREMHTAAPAVIVHTDDAEVRRLKAEVQRLTKERDAATQAAVARAQREERVKAVTLRVVDNRPVWAAKMGLTQRAPLVVMHSTKVITADVWEQPAED